VTHRAHQRVGGGIVNDFCVGTPRAQEHCTGLDTHTHTTHVCVHSRLPGDVFFLTRLSRGSYQNNHSHHRIGETRGLTSNAARLVTDKVRAIVYLFYCSQDHTHTQASKHTFSLLHTSHVWGYTRTHALLLFLFETFVLR
jgi:hypothetical protein